MTHTLRIAVTADLHWGHSGHGDVATERLRDFLLDRPPDLLLLGGDLGTLDHFGECLALFGGLSCRKALVPGNHDIWVVDDDPRGDSLRVYREHLPAVAAAHDFHYLDHGPLVLPEAGLAVVGSMNWYDYSWSLELLRQHVPDWEERLRTKRFSRGRHNDARFVRWPLDDVRFTAEVVAAFERQLHEALGQVEYAVVLTHHPAFEGISFPGEPSTELDDLLWDAFAGNRALELLLEKNAQRIPFVFCGHTHRAREGTLGTIRGYNIGAGYHCKRVLLLDWPSGRIEAHTFGESERGDG
ncbi:MAG TPA: metallophosphoesterase [Gemmataceae bacterium]|nr:metallophosphoesterase [Gemmataceae bacterium]